MKKHLIILAVGLCLSSLASVTKDVVVVNDTPVSKTATDLCSVDLIHFDVTPYESMAVSEFVPVLISGAASYGYVKTELAPPAKGLTPDIVCYDVGWQELRCINTKFNEEITYRFEYLKENIRPPVVSDKETHIPPIIILFIG